MRKKTFWISLFSGVVLGGLVLKFSQNPKAAAPKVRLELTDTPVPAETGDQNPAKTGKTIVAASAEIDQKRQQEDSGSNALSGKGLIAAGEIETKICCEGLSPTAQVYLTSDQEKKNLVIFVKRKVPFNPETGDCSHFLAAIPRPLDYDLNFQWWVVE